MSGQQIDLTTLPLDTLAQVKKQLDDELEHLTTSFTKLRQAQTRFKECIISVKTGVNDSCAGKTLLIPLTTSLYVPGELSSTSHVMVDVGTGYYVEKTTTDAVKFYAAKVDVLSKSLIELEKVVAQKGQNVRVVEEVIRRRVMEQQQQQGQGGEEKA
ncbi:Prefoldin subunit-domain-containing protein [Tricharina praecox]|uniref:Prefoldin subunit-domain-containing protein n=1 Tax=Tricharina praecox TaxID=43433 RepID=UPI002220F6DD|nr:Prefoldin subunit-domain-containing protein [Tricharina praecox]KAI5855627.1 Prefoldin subunit-domain-containing protein [Tricharina praecox]